MSISRSPQFDLKDLADELMREDFGEAEQTASAASAYLVPPASAGGAAGLQFGPPSKNPFVQKAVSRLLGLQDFGGRFGVADPSGADPWLTAYVVDFLSRARAAGVEIPDQALERGLSYLGRHADPQGDPGAEDPATAISSQSTLEGAAYAVAVLAQNGRMDTFRLRYFRDRFLNQMRNPLAVGWIAAAYAALGDSMEAAALFSQALAMPKFVGAADPYASDLRDQTALTAIMAESGAAPPMTLAGAMGKAVGMASSRRRFSPQEAAWAFRASVALTDTQSVLKLAVGDNPTPGPGPVVRATDQGSAGPLPPVKNLGDAPLSVAVTATGAATAADPKEGGGFEVQHWLFDRAGKPADPMAVKQDDLLVVVLTGKVTSPGPATPVVVDKLPAGWQILAPTVENAGAQLPWLKDLTGAAHVDARDDRYLAIPNLAGDRREFKLAYIVRAVTPGQFLLPGPFVEDIYRPDLFARGPNGKTKIDPR
jgi:hypothetical protein